MIGWNEGVTNAISYIEENLDKELDIKDIADKAYVSAFYFQKIFHVLCEFTVGEYIRNRRLTLAAEKLASTDARVIDVSKNEHQNRNRIDLRFLFSAWNFSRASCYSVLSFCGEADSLLFFATSNTQYYLSQATNIWARLPPLTC